ncbi:MAG: hypothetical protein ABW065_09570 [Solirubrobacterales bacterium]
MDNSILMKWQKGGLRYAKLQRIVPDFFAPEKALAFFVGVKSRGGETRLLNPFTPFQREYVIAVTADELAVLRLRLPGVFRASIAGVDYRSPRANLAFEWKDGRLSLGHVSYAPISFHGQDAEQLVEILRSHRVTP